MHWPESILQQTPVVSLEVKKQFEYYCDSMQLPSSVISNLQNIYLPLATWIATKHQQQSIIIGINGPQGSGKSSLCLLLKCLLELAFHKKVVNLSIDDFYLSRQARFKLSQTIHPLLKTRGVPGTHDTQLLQQCLSQLRSPQAQNIRLPRFDKSLDDVAAQSLWPEVKTPLDIILFEGWCVGTQAQPEDLLTNPINDLEQTEDADAQWRHYVNTQLKSHYQNLFEQLDYLLMLKIPDFSFVKQWRALQEQQLASTSVQTSKAHKIMDDAAIEKFIKYFERLTRWSQQTMPDYADLILALNEQHQIAQVEIDN